MKLNKVTLISTVHNENGNCNSEELYRIIESIGPDVIFEELSKNLFDRFYTGNQIPEPLEVKCIRRYLLNNDIKNIPVDIESSPNLSNPEVNYMFKELKKYKVYEELNNEHDINEMQDGFSYLNSEKCAELFEKMKIAELSLIEFNANKDILSNVYRLFHEEQNNRENAMLQNIYNYSKENPYNQAVFLIGCAHRKSIKKKIKEFEAQENLKLNWNFFNELS